MYKGTVSGKYDVEIVSSRLATDYDNNPCIIITYNFTNNSDKNAAFLTSVGTTVFQNSIECNTAVIMSDVMDAEPSLSQVQPGGTITVDCAYSLHDTVNPVTVQVAPLFNLSGDIDIQRIFTLS